MKIKKGFIIFGVCMALAGTLVASALPWRYSHRAHALVLVKDPSNISEAIKTVNHLFNILSNEQMQVALQILQMKKLDENALFSIWNYAKTNKEFMEKLTKGEQGEWGGVLYKLDGMLSGSSSIPTTWSEGLGEVTDILDGQLSQTNGGCFGNGRPGMVVVNQILKDTATVAQVGQASDVEIGKMVMYAYEQGQKAEGQLQATQAGNAIAQGMAIMNGNRSLGYFSSAYAADRQRALAKEAYQISVINNTSAHSWNRSESYYDYDW